MTGGSGTVVVVVVVLVVVAVVVEVAWELLVGSEERDALFTAPPAPPHAARSNETPSPAARRGRQVERRKRTARE